MVVAAVAAAIVRVMICAVFGGSFLLLLVCRIPSLQESCTVLYMVAFLGVLREWFGLVWFGLLDGRDGISEGIG